MPQIRTAINQRQYVVPGGGVTIAVFTRNGDYRHMRFKGFVDCELAPHLPDAIPVKLYAKAYTLSADTFGKWVELSENEALQGCLFQGNVWAVLLDGVPRIVPRTAFAYT